MRYYNLDMSRNPVVLPGQLEYLLPGCNALETSVLLGQSWTRKGKPYMLVDTVKQVLETLDRNQVAYAVIGGLAVSHHAVPRLTHDVDLIVMADFETYLTQLAGQLAARLLNPTGT